MYIVCESSQHDKVSNGNGYYFDGKPPPLCPTCGDPWIDKEIYDPELVVKAEYHALDSKRQPHRMPDGEIYLESFFFTDDELLSIIERDRHGDVIKAALAAKYLELRSEVRPLADYGEWKCPNKMINAAWVAGHITCALKWVDWWQRGFDPTKLRS